jgi:pimeloyl-ACP methyl ester carboxylesterase
MRPPTQRVVIDNGPDIRPFAELVQRLAPALRGPGFSQVWRRFEDSLGIDRIPEPLRQQVLEDHVVAQQVILAYWETVLRADPDRLQSMIDTQIHTLEVPLLGVFGRPISAGERERFGWLPDVQLEEWLGDGHFVHLVDPDRFATVLRRFVDHCTAAGDNLRPRRRDGAEHK